MSQLVEPVAGPVADGVAADGLVRVLGGRRVLDGVDLRVPAGGRVGIVGRSGAGKSTLLSVVAGLDEADGGRVAVGGASDAAARLARCALMPQRDCLLPWRTALDNAGLALENAGLSRGAARERARPLFGRLGLAGSEELRPAKLSGGMRQRVAFARTLLADKPVLLLDEPFGALDAITRAELQEWLVHVLDGEPRTALLVTHDVEEALLLCDRVLVLGGGRVVAALDVDLARDAPRRDVVTSPAFVELRERALEAVA
ncbi:MAG TPA: ABC transporter ATP-binding protein [Gaiellaceae bacterium]|jgi:NitT/TauT family transport system ATP-binding protein|nr:ABC transporter ATP-binding protein [Gaiellaceae bacterium]